MINNQLTKMLTLLMKTIDIPDDEPDNNVSLFVEELLTNMFLGVEGEIRPVLDTIIQSIVLNCNAQPQMVLNKIITANEAFVEFYNSELPSAEESK